MRGEYEPEKYNLTAEQKIKFWSRVDKGDLDGSCWNWTASVNSSKRSTGGYGKFKANGRHLRANIYAWAFFNGVPPPGMVVSHTCDNRRCVNPQHLKLVTQKENVADMVAKGRAHKLYHFSERQLMNIADRLGIERMDMLKAARHVELMPTVRWPMGRPVKQSVSY